MNRCCNDLFSYCSTPERQTSEEKPCYYFDLVGHKVETTKIVKSCHHQPSTCPYIKNQSQLPTAQLPPQQTPRQEHPETRRRARRHTSQLVDNVIESLD